MDPTAAGGASRPMVHVIECAAEFAGAAAVVFAVLSAVFASSAHGVIAAHLTDRSSRRAVVGVVAGLATVAVVYSPVGRRSGAHLNPAVTVAFARLGKVSAPDVAGYLLAQASGALGGAAAARAVWGTAASRAGVGVTLPGAHGLVLALVAEAGFTFLFVSAVLQCVDRMRLAAWTAVIVSALAVLIRVAEAPASATSLNPARSLASAAVAGIYRDLWVYLVAPVAGALAAAAFFRVVRRPTTVCAKMFHSTSDPCPFIGCGYNAPSSAGLQLKP